MILLFVAVSAESMSTSFRSFLSARRHHLKNLSAAPAPSVSQGIAMIIY